MAKQDKYLVVVSGPAGTGKDTVVARLLKKHPEFALSVSATSRAPRGQEQDGREYYFLSREAFEGWIAAGKLLEHAQYGGNYYGTPKSEVDKRIEAGTTVVLVIEVEGAGNIKKLYPGCTTVFLLPPSMDELEKRLRGRGTDSEESIRYRLARAKQELMMQNEYDERLVNDEVDACADRLYELIRARQG